MLTKKYSYFIINLNLERSETMFLERLIAGALLKFNREIDSTDLTILEGMLNQNIVKQPLKLLANIVELKDNKYQLKYTLDVVLANNLTVKETLEQIEGEDLKKFFTDLDLKEFILRKVDLSKIEINDFKNNLNSEEIDVLVELNASMYISKIFDENGAIYDDYERFCLTKKGQVYLFMKKYSYQIACFKQELIAKEYNPDLLFLYLESINLERPFTEIFSLETFRLFGSIYDLDISNNKLAR